MQYLVRNMLKQDDQGSLLTSLDMDYSQRVILLGGEINEETAVILSSALRALARESDEEITLYIQSPGGLVSAGLSIYDTMQSIRCDVATVACGLTGSMAALLLAAGAKGKRWAQPHAQILIHQPMGEVSGRATDVHTQVGHLLKTRGIINEILSSHTGKSVEQIEKDTMGDHLMDAEEALIYGAVDRIGDPIGEW